MLVSSELRLDISPVYALASVAFEDMKLEVWSFTKIVFFFSGS